MKMENDEYGEEEYYDDNNQEEYYDDEGEVYGDDDGCYNEENGSDFNQLSINGSDNNGNKTMPVLKKLSSLRPQSASSSSKNNNKNVDNELLQASSNFYSFMFLPYIYISIE